MLLHFHTVQSYSSGWCSTSCLWKQSIAIKAKYYGVGTPRVWHGTQMTILCFVISWQWSTHTSAACMRLHTLFDLCEREPVCTISLGAHDLVVLRHCQYVDGETKYSLYTVVHFHKVHNSSRGAKYVMTVKTQVKRMFRSIGLCSTVWDL